MDAKGLSTALLLFFISLSCYGKETVKVQTPLGRVSGYRVTNLHGKKYDLFLGIPYAQPPVGKLRFAPPQPIKKWDYELQATKKGYSCIRYEYLSYHTPDKVYGSEDCLYLNIYAPVKNNTKTLLPVILWIHGGCFQWGQQDVIDENASPNNDVILVTINHRLGPFGFLSTGDSVVSGNMGLKDQSMALRWVYDNIRSFGGNPKNITLTGFSSGGTSAQYHSLSPLSAGLFQGGIAASSSLHSPTSLVRNASAKAKKLGAYMGCPTNNSMQMINCLREVPPRILAEATASFYVWFNMPLVPFGPVVEVPGPNAFISRSPIDIINSGEAYDVPWIMSFVSEEGLFPVSMFFNDDAQLKQLNDNWTSIAPYTLEFNETVPLSQQRSVAQRIRRYYLGSNKINSTDASLRPLIALFSDRIYVTGIVKTARLLAKMNKSPVWTYYYTYRANHSSSEIFSDGSTRNLGVSHGDDTDLWLTYLPSTANPNDIKMQQILYDIYSSFATRGKPRISGVKWQPLNSNRTEFQYLRISGPRNISMEANSTVGHVNFWDSLKVDGN